MAKYIALGMLSGLGALASSQSISPAIMDMYKEIHGLEKLAGYCGAYAIPGVFVAGVVLCICNHNSKDRTQTLESTITSKSSLPLKK